MLPDDQPNNIIPFRRRPSSSDIPATPDGPAPQAATAPMPPPQSPDQRSPEQPIARQPATAASSVAVMDGDSPVPPVPRINWRLTAFVLCIAFVVGLAIAWLAIAVGARIVGIWPLGLASYIILLGGGVTMMLTAGLLMMAFFNEGAQRQDGRHHSPTDSPEKHRPGSGETDRSSRRG